MKEKRLLNFSSKEPSVSNINNTKKAIFWVTSVSKDIGRDLFFVNDSDEILDFVKAEDGGFITCDDDVVSTWTQEGKGYRYINVLPKEAVKVAEFDDNYDLDYVLGVSITIKSESRGVVNFSTPLEKGGVEGCVLFFDSGDVGDGCTMTQVEREER